MGKDWLQYWVKSKGFDYCEETKKTSQRIGKRVHTALERYLGEVPLSRCVEDLVDGQEKKMFENGIDVCNILKLKPKMVESQGTFYHPELEVNGTPDFLGYSDGKLVGLDWKTDSVPKAGRHDRERQLHYKLQGYAYYRGAVDLHGMDLTGFYFVRVAKDLSRHVYFYSAEELKEQEARFTILRGIYREIYNR